MGDMEDEEEDPWDKLPPQQHFPGRHHYFVCYFQPFEAKDGPLQTGPGEEASLRGRVNATMLTSVLPEPGGATRVVVCGPQGLLDTVGAMLLDVGHAESAIIPLRASSTQATESVRTSNQNQFPANKPSADVPKT